MAHVDDHTRDQMAAAVSQAIWGPTGVAYLLPPAEREMLGDGRTGSPPSTVITVESEPSRRDLALIDVGKDSRLIGLFTHPPSVITLYAANIIETRQDPVDVALHELGHRFSYDHALRPAVVAMAVTPGGRAAAQVVTSGDDSCPVCVLHSRTAVVVGLLDGLRKRAHLQHQIPQGLGGTIPLAVRKTGEARANLALVATMLPDRPGQIRELDGLLDQLQAALSEWQTPESVSRAHTLAYAAWDRSYDIAHAYWLQALYGPAMAPVAVA